MVWDLQYWWPVIANPVRDEDRERGYRHFSGMVAHARALQNALADERPLIGTKDINWESFEADLARLIEAAKAETETARPKKTRGRPPEKWRDDLIALVDSRYPKVSRRGLQSHFEGTVVMLLGFLNAEPEDVRATIRDVRKRRPQPPFTSRRI